MLRVKEQVEPRTKEGNSYDRIAMSADEAGYGGLNVPERYQE